MSEFYFLGSKVKYICNVFEYTTCVFPYNVLWYNELLIIFIEIEILVLQLVFIFYPKILIPEKIHQAHGAAQKAKKSLQKPKTQKSVCT